MQVTQAEGMAYSSYMQRGLQLEADALEAQQSFTMAVATQQHAVSAETGCVTPKSLLPVVRSTSLDVLPNASRGASKIW